MEKDRNGILYVGKRFSSSQQPGGYPLERNASWRAKLPCHLMETVPGCKSTSPRYVHSVQNDPDLSRDFFVRLWIADRKKSRPSGKQKHKVLKSSGSGETFVDGRTLFGLLERSYSGASATNEKSYDKIKSDLKQPPTSQSVTGILEPISLEEARFLVSCVAHDNYSLGKIKAVSYFAYNCLLMLIPVRNHLHHWHLLNICLYPLLLALFPFYIFFYFLCILF